jgi:hypothetical protein
VILRTHPVQECREADFNLPTEVLPILASVAKPAAFGLSPQYDWAIPIAAMRVSTKEKITSPGETSRIDS